MAKSKPEERTLVAYLGAYMAAGIVYTLHLYRLPIGLYESELRFTRSDGYMAGAIAPRFYDSDLQAANGERRLLQDYLTKGMGSLPEDILTLHYGDYKVDDHITVVVDPEMQSLEQWSSAVADKVIADAAKPEL
ncbi:hypothetical protein QTI24_26670 [Variovorax sp. J22P240]|uniref:hypothetical protein n=1 Tax=Variovorax sp. J22P240 TaxID=3053514 RepID=UPI002578E50F|nr:hypothetical protein [Variovorax sp. J22P240]MDM0002217.1 hypothetical protein [Variovorax sp. J22P240]